MEGTENYDQEYIVISKLDGICTARRFMMNRNIDKEWAKEYLKNMFCKSLKERVEIIDILQSKNWVTGINEAWGSLCLDNPRLEIENE